MQIFQVFSFLFSKLMNFALPFGITFGVLICTVMGLPILLKMLRRLF